MGPVIFVWDGIIPQTYPRSVQIQCLLSCEFSEELCCIFFLLNVSENVSALRDKTLMSLIDLI